MLPDDLRVILGPPVNQLTFSESIFRRYYCVAMVLGSGAHGGPNLGCCDLSGCWVATFSSRNHLLSCFWLPAATVWRTRHSHTHYKKRNGMSLAVVACVRGCSCPQVKCKRPVGFVYLSLCVWRISPIFDNCSTSKSRCRPPFRKGGRATEGESQAGVHKNTKSIHPLSAIARTSRRSKTQRVNIPEEETAANYTSVTRKP